MGARACACVCVCNGSKCRYAGTAADALSSQGRRPREAERGGADVLFKYRGAEPCALILGRTTLPDLFGDVHVDQHRWAWIELRPDRPWVGMEAVWKIDVVDFPAFVVVDDKGNDFFAKWSA